MAGAGVARVAEPWSGRMDGGVAGGGKAGRGGCGWRGLGCGGRSVWWLAACGVLGP